MGTPKGTRPWNAGTSKGWLDKRGYRWMYVTENGKQRARREHRVIMERHLGRRLEPWELVHHKDGNPSNNDISNLEIQQFDDHTRLHHRGSRRTADIKRTLEGFALMREELKHVRGLNADLLEALKAMDRHIMDLAFYIDLENQQAAHGELDSIREIREAAIARAEGEA